MKSQRGFSLIELLVVITIIGILAALAIPNMTKARIKARETEVKSNLKIIQTAIERFNVDEGEYPEYLLGGNERSWGVFYGRGGDPDIEDPLVAKNYLDDYPKNPFVSEQNGYIYLEQSGGDPTAPGSGDPRFGIKGTSMPNSVDDPLYFASGSDPAETLNMAGSPLILNYCQYGGRKLVSGEPTRSIIEGSFFYRVTGPISMYDLPEDPERSDFTYLNLDRYILAGFGSSTTKGLDVIRLTGAGDYEIRPDTGFAYVMPLLLPEAFGGGDGSNNPFFPANPSVDGEPFPYGAPDGLEDGIVIVMTSEGEAWEF